MAERGPSVTPGPSDPHVPPPDHARHDPLAVAAAADRGGRLPPELAACPDCQALHADLVALAAAVPTAALPARPRDFRLTPADAARLRPAGWRGWLGRIGTSRDLVTRPLAIGLTTLGLAGLLVATVPSVLPSGGSTAGTTRQSTSESFQQDAAGTGGAAAAAPAGSAAPAAGPAASGEPAASAVAGSARDAYSPAAAAPQPTIATGATGTGGAAVATGAGDAAASMPGGAAIAAPTPGIAAAPASPGTETPTDETAGTLAKSGERGSTLPVAILSSALLLAGVTLFALRRRAGYRPAG